MTLYMSTITVLAG